MYVYYNPNPSGRNVGDCAVRALTKALDWDWEDAYIAMAINGFLMNDLPSSNSVWGSVLKQHGFRRQNIPNNCPDCYTAEDFIIDHPQGTYVLGFGSHTATVKDGNLYDSFNSLSEMPQYFWYKER